ncbi:MAG TPA: hypothetical protein VG267_00325 [Terracidiphilus sp.]|jgi:hypothetical protein|nr:hypothetical protein [Terracidiphilus sp.]
MSLDLRIPMGLLFSFVGVIMTAFGLSTHDNAELYAKSLGIDVNLWWGMVMLVFGQTMFHLGRRGQNRARQAPGPGTTVHNPAMRRGH